MKNRRNPVSSKIGSRWKIAITIMKIWADDMTQWLITFKLKTILISRGFFTVAFFIIFCHKLLPDSKPYFTTLCFIGLAANIWKCSIKIDRSHSRVWQVLHEWQQSHVRDVTCVTCDSSLSLGLWITRRGWRSRCTWVGWGRWRRQPSSFGFVGVCRAFRTPFGIARTTCGSCPMRSALLTGIWPFLSGPFSKRRCHKTFQSSQCGWL